ASSSSPHLAVLKHSWAHRWHSRYQSISCQREILLVLSTLDFVRHALHVIQSIEAITCSTHTHQAARAQHAAITCHIERPVTSHYFRACRSRCQTHHDGLRNGHLRQIVAERSEIRRQQVRRNRLNRSQRRLQRIDGRNWNRDADADLLNIGVDQRNLALLLIELEVH